MKLIYRLSFAITYCFILLMIGCSDPFNKIQNVSNPTPTQKNIIAQKCNAWFVDSSEKPIEIDGEVKVERDTTYDPTTVDFLNNIIDSMILAEKDKQPCNSVKIDLDSLKNKLTNAVMKNCKSELIEQYKYRVDTFQRKSLKDSALIYHLCFENNGLKNDTARADGVVIQLNIDVARERKRGNIAWACFAGLLLLSLGAGYFFGKNTIVNKVKNLL